MKLKKIARALLMISSAGLLCAQGLDIAPPKPDSPEVKALIEKTKKAGGPMWAQEEHFFCEEPRANRADDQALVGFAHLGHELFQL